MIDFKFKFVSFQYQSAKLFLSLTKSVCKNSIDLDFRISKSQFSVIWKLKSRPTQTIFVKKQINTGKNVLVAEQSPLRFEG